MGLRNPLFLKVETSNAVDSFNSSFRPDAQASINLQTQSGDFKLVSSSFQEYKFTDQGLHKRDKQHTDTAGTFYQVSEKDVELLERLGEGASSTVYKAHLKAANKFVAIKSINCMEKLEAETFSAAALMQEKRKQIMNDIRGLSDVMHPTLVQFLGAYRVKDSGQISLVLEYLDRGSVADLIKQVGMVPENVLSSISAQILQGLTYLHKTRHTVHRDIKPANVLLSSSGQVKIADFGISAFVDNTMAVCNTFLGTVTYMSPERINSQPYSFAADIWSFGLSLLECVAGRYPFDAAAGPLVLMMQILKEEIPIPGKISEELHDFLRRCLCKDPYQRAQADELLRHPFITMCTAPTELLQDYLKRGMKSPTEEGAALWSPCESKRGYSTDHASAAKEEIIEMLDRYFISLSARSKQGIESSDLARTVVMVHEGVETRGRRAVMTKLENIRDLQSALGANQMIIDGLEMQLQKLDRWAM